VNLDNKQGEDIWHVGTKKPNILFIMADDIGWFRNDWKTCLPMSKFAMRGMNCSALSVMTCVGAANFSLNQRRLVIVRLINHELSLTMRLDGWGLVIRNTSNAVNFCPCAVVASALRSERHGRRFST